MALSKTAQPMQSSLRKIAVVVATAVSGMSAYAHAAETPKKEETITVTAAPAPQESACTGGDHCGTPVRYRHQDGYLH